MSGWMHRSREFWLNRLEENKFDLIVIGGGITGAGAAREGSLAGLKVALLEAGDFASGTSSRSTKLVHGGLRYLAQGDLRLVHEVGRERAVLQSLAPHLVEPLPMLLPLYQGAKHGLGTMSAAVWLYDRLAGVKKQERRKVLRPEEVLNSIRGISPEHLCGGVLYHEYVTDDARLTLATLQTASEWGAVILNDSPVEGLIVEQSRVQGVWALDRASLRKLRVMGTVVLNAAGPWIEQVISLAGSPAGPSRITHSRGIHLSFARERLNLSCSLAVPTPDQRLVFLIPKGEVVYCGTTDRLYHGDLTQPDVPEEDVSYLLGILNAIFPSLALSRADILGAWSGVRPLVAGRKAQETKDVSRKDEIWVSDNGLITVAGGKLTAYRKMAERILARVLSALNSSSQHGRANGYQRSHKLSGSLPLYGAKGIPLWEYARWQERAAQRLESHFGLTKDDSTALLKRYGDQAEAVLLGSSCFPSPAARISNRRIVPDYPLLESELNYMVSVEGARHLADVICRRTELGRLYGRRVQALSAEAGLRLQSLLGWTDKELENEITVCLEECWANFFQS